MLQLRMLNEYVYCPRLFYLEHVQGLFRDSPDTVHGRAVHERADENHPKVRRKKKAETEEPEPVPEEPLFTKTLSFSSETLGITGKLDALEETNPKIAVRHNTAVGQARTFLSADF